MIAVFAPFRVRFHLYAALLDTASTDQILFATDKILFVPPLLKLSIISLPTPELFPVPWTDAPTVYRGNKYRQRLILLPTTYHTYYLRPHAHLLSCVSLNRVCGAGRSYGRAETWCELGSGRFRSRATTKRPCEQEHLVGTQTTPFTERSEYEVGKQALPASGSVSTLIDRATES
jgi:hypothetical protein